MKSCEVVCVREYRELWEKAEEALRNGLRYQAQLKRNKLGKHGSRYCEGLKHIWKAETILAEVLVEIENEFMLEEDKRHF
jgi:hypothetical protein